ncbi:hypothetical protein I7I53_00781 [Histoplasma capsulatum var. duboisii H88]|uniref:Uncharacterized protein n=2 Tax=Ajellomyces capsulatus (strain H88) TaxID=544711 RepID=A0A8A1LNC3_AJEC8|nr:hypothetical protein I7I53_00781 [Histoplasma capsulatum var. duboisii H88]
MGIHFDLNNPAAELEMPAPLAKGLVITVTILLAAGYAVYENPQVKQWVRNSRRRIAIALHNLGDEINPQERSTDRRPAEDISMSEELSEEAEARRQKARSEISRRASVLEARKNKSALGSVGSFDSLVDKDGRLKAPSKHCQQPLLKEGESQAQASGVQVTNSDTVHLRPAVFSDLSNSISEMAPEKALAEYRQTLLNAIDRPPHSETSSHHPSESLVDLTPTSEAPGMDFAWSAHSEIQGHGQSQQEDPTSQSSYFSLASSQNTGDGEPDFYYARPPQPDQNITAMQLPQYESENPFVDQQESHTIQSVSSTPSVASSLSHIQNDPLESMSDRTLSDLESIHDGIHTPASWSEVGSVVSSNDGNNHQ